MLKLNGSNYYSWEANEAYWSASFVKEMESCPARAIARLHEEWQDEPSTALLVGSYVDSYFDGTLDEFVSNHPEIVNSRTGELKKDFVKAQEMIDRACSDKLFMEYTEGEKQKIFTGKIDGIPFKSKFDFYIPGERIVDLKTVQDMKPKYKAGEGLISFADYWNWPLQMAIYQYIEGNRLPVYLAVISKESPPDIDLIQIPQETLDAEIEVLRQKLPYYDAMRQGIVEPERCEHCAYCRATKKLSIVKNLDDFMEV